MNNLTKTEARVLILASPLKDSVVSIIRNNSVNVAASELVSRFEVCLVDAITITEVVKDIL